MTIQQLTEEEKCPKSSWSMFYKLCVDRFCGKMQSRVINTRLKQNEINDISQQQQQQQQQQVVKYPHISRAWFLDTRLFFIVITRLWWALLETTSQLVSAGDWGCILVRGTQLFKRPYWIGCENKRHTNITMTLYPWNNGAACYGEPMKLEVFRSCILSRAGYWYILCDEVLSYQLPQ